MYFRYMSIAFVTNGLGVFGLRILAAAGLANTDSVQYLTIWYFAGAALAFLAWLRSGKLLSREWLIGGAMAVCSLCGQLGMANALAGGLPGCTNPLRGNSVVRTVLRNGWSLGMAVRSREASFLHPAAMRSLPILRLTGCPRERRAS